MIHDVISPTCLRFVDIIVQSLVTERSIILSADDVKLSREGEILKGYVYIFSFASPLAEPCDNL